MVAPDNPAAAQSPEGQPAHASELAAAQRVGEAIARRRRERVHERLVDALNNPDPSAAVLGCISADLMTVGLRIGSAILRDAGQRPINLDDVEHESPAINLYIRVTKQVAQIEQIQLNRARARSDRPGR